MILQPVPGDPGTVRALATTLAAQGAVVAALARTLRGLADPGTTTWDGPAGAAFAARTRDVAPVLDSVAQRYAVSAAALRPLADVLAEAQAECRWAARVREDAWPRFLRWGDLMAVAQTSQDPGRRAEAEVYRARMVAEGEAVQDAERRHARGWACFREADQRCAEVLRGLGDDGLADSWTYDLLTGTSRLAGGVASAAGAVAWVPAPSCKVFAVVETAAEGVRLGADLAVRAAYGDGDWTAIALGAGAVAAGPASSVLRSGAGLTAAAHSGSTVTRAERSGAGVGTARRLRLGALDEANGFLRKTTNPAPRPVLPVVRPPDGIRDVRRWAGDQAEVRLTAYARARWLDDLEHVTASRGTSTGMLATAWAVEGAGTHLGRAADLRDHRAARHQVEVQHGAAGRAQHAGRTGQEPIAPNR